MNDSASMRSASPNPPISSSADNRPQDTLVQRGAFDAPSTPGTLGRLDKYEILRFLGEGAMGQVYLAREPVTGVQVALKIIKPQLADDPREVHRFLNEARHMYGMSHPHVLRVLDVSDRKEGPYYVMPYVEGGSLHALCKPGQALPESELLPIAKQVAGALAYAHSHGIIHRDLKPANVLLDKQGNACLSDFGLVRTVFNDSMVDPSASHLEGTAPYMSPAVARGDAEDTRCDIYAFGAVLYELLTGQLPYTGRTQQIILDQVLKGPPPPIRTVNPKANPALVTIAEGCMARELRDRYAAMSDVASDLDRVSKGKPPLGPHGQVGLGKRINLRRLAIPVAVSIACAALAIGLWQGAARWRHSDSSVSAWRATLEKAATAYDENRFEEALGLFDTALAAMNADQNTDPTVRKLFQGQARKGRNLARFILDRSKLPLPQQIELTQQKLAELNTNYTGKGTFTATKDGKIDVANLNGTALTDISPLRGLPLTGALRLDRNPVSDLSPLKGLRLTRLDISYTPVDDLRPLQGMPLVELLANYAQKIDDLTPLQGMPLEVLWLDTTSVSNIAALRGMKLTSLILAGTKVSDLSIIQGMPLKTLHLQKCVTLTSVTIPNSVTDIEKNAFNGCTKLTNVTIPNSVTNIGVSAFVNCTSLTNVTIPNSVTSIGADAFHGCAKLTSVTIPASVTSILQNPFPGSGQTSIMVDAENPAYSVNADGVLFNKEKTSLVCYPSAKGGSYVIPNSVTNIGKAAFVASPNEGRSTNLTSVTVPASVTSIDFCAFCRNTGLTSVYFKGNAPSLTGWGGFADCNNATIYYLPGTTGWGKEFGGRPTAVWNQSAPVAGLPFKFTVANDVVTITKYTGPGGAVTIPSTINGLPVTFLNYIAFWCSRVTDLTISDGVTGIGVQAIGACHSLTNVIIPKSVTWISGCAFEHSDRLTAIVLDAANPVYSTSKDGVVFNKDQTKLVYYPPGRAGAYDIPDSVRTIGDTAFRSCRKLTRVTIPNSVTNIEEWVLAECSGLTNVVIPKSVIAIGKLALFRCSALTSFMVDAANPAYSSADGVLFDKQKASLLKYPPAKAGSYVIPDSVTNLAADAFTDCTGLTSVTIPNSVTDIQKDAFNGCTKLTNVTIPNSVTNIGVSAFGNCTSLPNVTIPNSVTRINGCTFRRCTSLTTITIPDGVTSIDGEAFNGCTNLTSVMIPDSVTSIGGSAFNGCDRLAGITLPNKVLSIETATFRGCASLVSVAIPNGVTNIGAMAFDGCTRLTDLTIPDGVTSIGDCAFRGCASLANLTIPDGVTMIGGHWGGGTFANCAKLSRVTIPDNVTTIEVSAFNGCANLSTVTIGNSVTNIAGGAFGNCTNLVSVYFKGNAPSGPSDGVFTYNNKATVYHLPGAKGWGKEFGGRPTAVWNPPAK